MSLIKFSLKSPDFQYPTEHDKEKGVFINSGSSNKMKVTLLNSPSINVPITVSVFDAHGKKTGFPVEKEELQNPIDISPNKNLTFSIAKIDGLQYDVEISFL